MFCPIFLWVVKGLNDGIAQHVEREGRQVLEGVHHGTNHVVVQLNLGQDLREKGVNIEDCPIEYNSSMDTYVVEK